MPGRFTKIQYDDPEHDELIEKAYIFPEHHTINHILRNLVSNVEFIAILHGVRQLNAGTYVMNSELNRAFHEHLMLEQTLEMLDDHKLVSDRKNETIQLEKIIRSSFRNMLRLLKANPLLLSSWKKELGMEIGKCERALIKELSILGGLEPNPQLTAHKPVSSKLKDRQDFTARMEEMTTKISQKRQVIENLQSSVQKKREEERTLQEKLQITTEESQTMQKKLKREVDQISTQLNDLMGSNFEEEAALRRKIKRVDIVTERIIKDCDEEMEALQASFDIVTREYEEEVEEVKKLDVLYSELDVEYRYILEKRQLAVEKKEKEAKELVLKTQATLLIQAWWRGYCVRKALKQREKKGKKDKKGKKGKASKETKKRGKSKTAQKT